MCPRAGLDPVSLPAPSCFAVFFYPEDGGRTFLQISANFFAGLQGVISQNILISIATSHVLWDFMFSE
jgi:hypothetical protein